MPVDISSSENLRRVVAQVSAGVKPGFFLGRNQRGMYVLQNKKVAKYLPRRSKR